ncbi:MAG: AI-2E family transporter [Zoogloeaceae bacterium]|jgi:predicted PurR-regulated permease PerM|nr:AI-2E family transporter [Zoogloeaceae bacterium]
MNPKPLAQVTLIALLIFGCLLVLYPFLAAVLFAAVICVTTWPLYVRLHRLLRGRDTLSGLLMTLLLIVVLIAPTLLLSKGLSDAAHLFANTVAPWFQDSADGLSGRLGNLPYVGPQLAEYWQQLSDNREEVQKLLQAAYEPSRRLVLSGISVVGNGILQLALVIFISFFLYRDGAFISRQLREAASRLGGALGEELLQLSRGTVTGVMIGIVGTALAQALVALIGFAIAGVPGALLLAIAVFFLSMIPVGPPLIWGGAAFWLYSQGETGWAVFMVIYGLAIISSVDNFVKPILISRSASLPILLIALGVFGGILAFGFIGIFLGPTLLALAHTLFLRWLRTQDTVDTA